MTFIMPKYTRKVNTEKLQLEIAAITPLLLHASSYGNDVYVVLSEEPDEATKLLIDAAVANHNTVDIERLVERRLLTAMDFGKSLMVKYGTKNILIGRTTEQVIAISEKLVFIQSLLSSGSLYAALSKIEELIPDELILQSDIDYFKQELKSYLGIP